MKIIQEKTVNEAISREDQEDIRGCVYTLMELFMTTAGRGDPVGPLGSLIGSSLKKAIGMETIWINGRERMPAQDAAALKKVFYQAMMAELK